MTPAICNGDVLLMTADLQRGAITNDSFEGFRDSEV